MPDQPNPAKHRPVDVLFGEGNSPMLPNYVVEPPMPPANITQPIEFDGKPLPPLDERAASDLPIFSTPPVFTEPPSFSHSDDPRFVTLSFKIERLYDDIKAQLQDSPTLTQSCFDLLLHARQAYERHDYAHTEFFIQATGAKIKASAQSVQAARRPIVSALWAWEITALLLGGIIVAISYVTGLTLFGLPIATELIYLIRALGWGMIGGVLGAMINFSRLVQAREYDPAFDLNYFARPLIGLLLGALLFVFSQAGVLAGDIVIGDFKGGPIFLYLFAALAGFKQEYLVEFFDNIFKTIFHPQKK